MKSRGNRDKIVLATKVRGEMWPGPNGEGLSRVHIMRAVEDSLRRLQTDYIDLYQTHWVDLNTPIEETLFVLDDLVKQGKVRYLGASNYPAWRLMEALRQLSTRLNLARFDSYQPAVLSHGAPDSSSTKRCPCASTAKSASFPTPRSPQAFSPENTAKIPPRSQFRPRQRQPEKIRQRTRLCLGRNCPIPRQNHRPDDNRRQLTNPVITPLIIGANTVEQLNDTVQAAAYRLSEPDMAKLNEVTK